MFQGITVLFFLVKIYDCNQTAEAVSIKETGIKRELVLINMQNSEKRNGCFACAACRSASAECSASAALAMHFVNVIAKVNNKLNHTTADWYAFYILVRKFAHSVEYLVMGVASSFFFLVWAKKHPFLLAVVFCAVVSICDQLSKIVVPGREFDITDYSV